MQCSLTEDDDDDDNDASKESVRPLNSRKRKLLLSELEPLCHKNKLADY